MSNTSLKNRIRIRTALLFSGLYAFAITFLSLEVLPQTFWISPASSLLITLPLLGVPIVIAGLLLRRDVRRLSAGQHTFRRSFPFASFGQEYGDFEHVFFHDTDLSPTIVARLDRALSGLGAPLKHVELIDQDSALRSPDPRRFHLAQMQDTARGTKVFLALRVTSNASVQSVRWWVLMGGYVSRNSRLIFLGLSPISIWFWIVPYLMGRVNLVDRVRRVYGSAYNDMDVVTAARAANQITIDTLVAVLEDNGIDTSDLKMQRAQVMNINVSGGKVSMGNVVQGAMNKVAATVSQGAK